MSDIPDDVKRVLRQESRFGCCCCGNPILEYHHIIPKSKEAHNHPKDMMALCVSHHDMCTKGAMTLEEQRAYKAEPFNARRGYADGMLKVNQDYCAITLGTCLFVGKSIPFSVDGVPLLEISVKEGKMALSLTLYDKNERLLAEIVANEWISGDRQMWDLWCSYQKLKIRTKSSDVRLHIDASLCPMRLTARLMKRGKEIVIKPSGIRSKGSGAQLCMDNAALVGTNFSFDTQKGQLTVGPGMIYLNPDPTKRLEWSIAQMAKLYADD